MLAPALANRLSDPVADANQKGHRACYHDVPKDELHTGKTETAEVHYPWRSMT